MAPQRILHNEEITTQFAGNPEVFALAITDGLVSAVVGDEEILPLVDAQTGKIDLSCRRAIPGLNDFHLHLIRAGLFYDLELRWDGGVSVSQALQQRKEQADNTPSSATPPDVTNGTAGGSRNRPHAVSQLSSLDLPLVVGHLQDRWRHRSERRLSQHAFRSTDP